MLHYEPLVSVIIPVYNTENYIEECLKSILGQTYSNLEIIICDDCSTDKSLKILNKYKEDYRVKILCNDKNMRQARTRNKCIEESKGEYILLQDSDDISKPQRIKMLLEAFEPGIDFVGSGCFCFDDSGYIHETLHMKKLLPQKKDLLWGITHVHASLMIKKECLKAINGYRNSNRTMRAEDYDMVMRLYAAGFQGKNICDELYGYRVNQETIKRRDFRSRIDECFIRYEGFKANHILLPFGWLYVMKPIPAYFYQLIKYHRRFKKW